MFYGSLITIIVGPRSNTVPIGGNIVTQGEDFITTEGSDPLITEQPAENE